MSFEPGNAERVLGWRAPILANFTPEIAVTTRLTIVADPNHLLTEQEIFGELRKRGFDLVPFDDHVAFRFAYESRYRQIWDRGEKTNLVVVLRSPSGDLDTLPYDLLEQARRQGRCLSFSVGELFPKLVSNVVINLDRSCFDALFAAQAQDDSVRLGVDATKDFVLRHVFEIAPELIKTPASLLQVLLRRHYRGVSFPTELDERFIHLLNRGGRWKDWPLNEIVPSRMAFLAFLQERWPHFVQQIVEAGGDQVAESRADYGLRYSGPVELPFGHDDVKVYIDNLFQEGLLKPVAGFTADQVPELWMHVGVVSIDGDESSVRFERLMGRLQDEFPAEDANHREWVGFAQTWAEWAALRWEMEGSGVAVEKDSCEALHDRIEDHFTAWMQRNFGSLYNVSHFHRPAMVHHIPQHMAQRFTATGAQGVSSGPPTKHALIVVDGLALDQWVVLRDILRTQIGSDVQVEEGGSFAWVPTLTSVSRQAIFAGTEPLYFKSSLGTTTKEPAHWTRFWEDHKAKRVEVGYVREGKDKTDEDFLAEVFEVAEHPKIRMLGIVVGKVDQSMHGVKTGSAGLHAMVRQWAQAGAMGKLIKRLLDLGYEIILTADHGNIHSRGIGKPKVGSVADERGERAHVFPDENTRAGVAKEYPEAIVWPQIGLPESWHVLLAPGRSAFLPEGRQTVGHGGIAMEEVIVPFVKIGRTTE
jgi:PglZ domain-containing protein